MTPKIRIILWSTLQYDSVHTVLSIKEHSGVPLTKDEWKEVATLANAAIQWIEAYETSTLCAEDKEKLDPLRGLVISADKSDLVLPQKRNQS